MATALPSLPDLRVVEVECEITAALASAGFTIRWHRDRVSARPELPLFVNQQGVLRDRYALTTASP
jgi:hypothetical protein